MEEKVHQKDGKAYMLMLFLLALGVGIVFISAFMNTSKVKQALNGFAPAKTHMPKAISLLLVAAQITEFARISQHFTVITVIATLILFTIWMATKSGTEGELF